MFEGSPTVTDYVVVTGAYDHKDEKSTRPLVEFTYPRKIHRDIWITQIDHTLCDALLDACEPRGENFKPVRQYGCAYALYRENALADPHQQSRFDADGALYKCVALSRLVHPTSVGFETAARIRQWPGGTREIIPAGRSTLNASAYVIAPNENWLVPDDLPLLRDLLDALHSAPLPRRLESALWHHETAARQYFIDLRWTLLTTSLEALVRIKDERLPSRRFAGSTQVFVDRLLAIGNMDGTLAVEEAELREMYAQRSLLTHGLAFGTLDEEHKAVYRAQERLVRGILRKAFLDLSFRDIFGSDMSIATRLPLR